MKVSGRRSAGLLAVLPLLATLVGGQHAVAGESARYAAGRATQSLGPRDPSGMVVLDGHLYFGARRSASSAWALWRSDGSRTGTGPIEDVAGADRYVCCNSLTGVGHQLFFLVPAATGHSELWVSDGTRLGTHTVGDGSRQVFGVPGSPTAFDGLAYFSGSDLETGYQLWRSDGTAAGTQPVQPPGGALEQPSDLTVVGDLMLAAGGLAQRSVWATDGTAAGTVQLASMPGPRAFTPVGGPNALFLSAVDLDPPTSELWRTDGTSAGTARVTDTPFVTPYLTPAAVPGRMLFGAAVGEPHLKQLWVSDGTAAGTQVLRAPGMARYAVPGQMLRVGDEVYVVMRDADQRRELWRTDGTPEGTVRITDISRGTAYDIRNLTRVGKKVYFTVGANDLYSSGTYPRVPAPDQLWRTDGTRAGTKRVGGSLTWEAVSDMAAFKGELWFAGQRQEDGPVRLWRSDGTSDGTRVVTAKREAR